MIVFQGNTYQGNAAGMWNPSSGSVTGQFWGGQTLSGSNSSTIFPEIYPGVDTNTWPLILQVTSNQLVTYTNIIGTNLVPTIQSIPVTNVIAIEPVGTNVYQDSVYMNGSFQGQMQNAYPNQTFTAFGTAQQQQLAPPVNGSGTEGSTPVQYSPLLNIPVTVQGVRISDTYTSFSSVSNAVPYTFTSYTMTNIGTFGQNQ